MRIRQKKYIYIMEEEAEGNKRVEETETHAVDE